MPKARTPPAAAPARLMAPGPVLLPEFIAIERLATRTPAPAAARPPMAPRLERRPIKDVEDLEPFSPRPLLGF